MKTLLFPKALLMFFLASAISFQLIASPDAIKWQKHELVFTSDTEYENPVQDVKSMEVTFTSPSGWSKR
jgi:hypothetical protein